jgi:hypothetical protein
MRTGLREKWLFHVEALKPSSVEGQNRESRGCNGCVLPWRPPRRTPYNWMLDSPRRVRESQDILPAAICVIRVIRGQVS